MFRQSQDQTKCWQPDPTIFWKPDLDKKPDPDPTKTTGSGVLTWQWLTWPIFFYSNRRSYDEGGKPSLVAPNIWTGKVQPLDSMMRKLKKLMMSTIPVTIRLFSTFPSSDSYLLNFRYFTSYSITYIYINMYIHIWIIVMYCIYW